ncbi:TPA: hypothetical protein HA338_04220 [Methanosarcina acetivorans]|uniref:Uncharacterized protein n=2 Tax=Methanosarcina acetivorans TaxID=2214 RepID=Q8TRU9_METAC|nr:VanZ family protein [Methanosarcina acetivorans]AAM04495.1 predicted protein [Methanosarcina acetivorans C2A]HIH93266.1 hypothetical protein [Methanosarcina acetivorans]
MVFYLSVSAGIGYLKNLLKMDMGYPIRNALLANDLSSVVDFFTCLASYSSERIHRPWACGDILRTRSFTILRFLSSKNSALVKYSAIGAVFIGTAYGILNEIFQTFLPYRDPSVADAISNLIRLVLAHICVIFFVLTLRAIIDKKKELKDRRTKKIEKKGKAETFLIQKKGKI